jgi:hypothetical protein
MKITKLLNDFNISYVTEGNKHCTKGWVNIHCPFCAGSQNYHLGWNIEKEYFYCWRCGHHRTIETLCKLSQLSAQQVKELIREYKGRPRISNTLKKRAPRIKGFQYPSGVVELQQNHRKYLEGRNFDPDYIVNMWGIKGTSPVSQLANIGYQNRILAPIYWNGQVVSFQTRAIGKAEPKYKACPQERELIQHKHILYGKQKAWGTTGICVEGITDVWRFGPSAFAVFGISYRLEQVREMIKHFKRVVVVFDNDPQAIKQADKLVGQLAWSGVKAFSVSIIGDPASMNQDDANHLVKEVLK